jgi:hypothetical protein
MNEIVESDKNKFIVARLQNCRLQDFDGVYE